MTKSLILVRGLPGSGKTTFANTIALDAPVLAADDFFTKDGKYNFNKDLLGQAHSWCLRKTEYYMQNNKPRVFVANTFTTTKEMKPYYELAKKYGYAVFSIIVENRHKGVNVHNVPEVTLGAMEERFDIKL